jgi:CheY-like chemotaxis protein
MANDTLVLIIDDEPDFAFFLRAVVRPLVGRVLVVHSGPAGLEAIRTQRPDLVLCDVGLPELDGFELRRRTLADPTLAAIPFLFISATHDLEVQLAGLRLGAVDYLTKPVEAATLAARVVHLLEQRAAAGVRPAGADGPAPSAPLAGSLALVPPAHLLQLLEGSHACGRLVIEGQTPGEIHLQSGLIAEARAGAARGEDAVLALLELRAGDFRFTAEPIRQPPPQGMLRVGALIAHGDWAREELAALGDWAPKPDDLVLVNRPPGAASCFPGDAWWERFVAMPSGTAVPLVEIARRTATPVALARVIVGKAIAAGALEVVATLTGEVVTD